MGWFDKMFGSKADEAAAQPDANQRFNDLKAKYSNVLSTVESQNVQLHNLHVESNKLYIRGTAPSEAAKNAVWDAIKATNPNVDDITADIDVNEQHAEEQAAAAASAQTYTVQSGDNLSKISKQFYGTSSEYMKIFYANRDKLNDPDMIKVGQELVIPS